MSDPLGGWRGNHRPEHMRIGDALMEAVRRSNDWPAEMAWPMLTPRMHEIVRHEWGGREPVPRGVWSGG